MKRTDVAIAVVMRDGLVLICQRLDKDAFGGFWEFPGGKCEPGETPESCLVRELREELNLDIRIGEALPTIQYDYPGLQVMLHPFTCQCIGEPTAIGCQRLKWVKPGELADYRFPPANGPLLARIVQMMGDAASLHAG